MRERVIRERSIFLVILLLIFTLGLYGIFWIASMQNDVRSKTGEGYSGGVTVLVTILTFGIYGIYWSYVMGGRLQRSGAPHDEGILYIILNLVGLGIVADCLMQNELNKIARNSKK